MILNTPTTTRTGRRNIQYLNRDFGQLRQALIDMSKVYYPNTYKDFSPASPGMMFMEQTAMVGDVMSYYIDYQYNESELVNAQERKNLINAAKSRGYKVKVTTPSVTNLDVYQLVPAIMNSDGTMSPDLSFAQVIKPGMSTTSDSGVGFLTDEPVDFTVDTQNDPLTVSVYQRDASGNPEFYVLKKTVSASSGTIVTTQFTVGSPVPFYQIQLSEDNVIGILDIYDSDGNRWYETDYMAQDLVPIDVTNIYQNDTSLATYRDTTPMLMKFLRTSRRFTSNVDENDITTLEFGSGTNIQDDELIIPSINTIAQVSSLSGTDVSIDPSNFLSSKIYGQAPANTTLTIRYIVGGGVASNVNANSITSVQTAEFFGDITELSPLEQNLTNMVRSSIRVNNPKAAVGGRDTETNDEIRNNSMANFGAQNRLVTQQDYQVRAYGMPAKYGSIAKVYAVTDSQLDSIIVQAASNDNQVASSQSPQNVNTVTPSQNNPFAINLYVLCYDGKHNLIPTNPAIQQNLVSYLNQYRMLTDSIRIIDGYIINIGVNFSIITYKNYNKRDVLANCIATVQNYFSIDNMQFCEPISISNLRLQLGNIDGVQSVSSLNISNLTARDGDYSPNAYDINAATRNDIVYPSVDPSIFEVKYPSSDIIGKVS
jgi:hypothetical protein